MVPACFRPSWLRCLSALACAWCAVGSAAAPRVINDTDLRMPAPGDFGLQVISPTLLQATIITAPKPGAKPLDLSQPERAGNFRVDVDGNPAPATVLSAKRRVLYAPLKRRDLRVRTDVYLHLQAPLGGDAVHQVSVTTAAGELWPAVTLKASSDPLRYSPAIHVNQEGYTPKFPKLALVGFYLGTAGELPIAAEGGFDIVDAETGQVEFHGALKPRRDVGFTTVPRPYQSVYEADFTKLDRPGNYRLRVAGLGASLPFRIADGEMMNFTRAFALGLYHQRCGTTNELPFTRFTHDACHVAPAEVPMPDSEFGKAWKIIAELDKDVVKPEHPEQQLKHPRDQRYPFVRQGRIDVSGGHHDAGDYSKYTINSASLVNALIFAVDAFPGVAELDNLGLPESGDGISDVLQEVKWESDFLAKLQDEDGGFYFLVYPRDRRYENDVPPDRGDPQIVWPKTTAVTAAGIAALAQCASSPAFRKQYPDVANRYLAQAKRGWAFLERALARNGRAAYQRLTHYGDAFEDHDELAWAAAELFVATGDRSYEKRLFEWYPNPSDPRTFEYGWRHASFAYGNALRAYAFSVRTGRLRRNQVDAGYLTKCEVELKRAGEAALRASEENAYGASYPEASKRIGKAGWFFPSDEAFDITVAYQLQQLPRYEAAVLANLNYEAGGNPVNRTFITGLGQRRQRETVNQFAQTDDRVLPPSGIPIGSLNSDFAYLGPYKTELRDESWPNDDAAPPNFPLYDRWSDDYNFNSEFVIVNLGRSLGSLAFWAAQTPLKTQPWKSATARIVGPTGTVPLHEPTTFRLECPDLDLSTARIVWEGRDQEPAFGRTFTVTPTSAGRQWVEAEAALPDGRRVFAHADFRADAPVVTWVDGALPRGASEHAEGGDTWDWIKPASKPAEFASHAGVPQHESALAEGIHEHGFYDAEATLAVAPGDVLFAYIFIDPKHPPKTIMLEFNDGSNEHRAFWGENHIPYGRMGTESQRPMGPLPPTGRWVRLEVPAKAVGLENRNIKGMVFRLYGGRLRWDAVGKMSAEAKHRGIFPVGPAS